MAAINEQQQIKNWFEKTYANRSKLYLRPPEAYEVFMTLLAPEADKKILDVACGPGRLLQVAEGYQLKTYGIDLSENAIEQAKENLPKAQVACGNAESLPFSDNQFDYITCIGSLERFLNLEKALSEQYRVGAQNARYCFMVRNSKTFGWKVIKEGLGFKNTKGHQGAKSLEEWTAVFEKIGFKIEKVVSDQWPRKRILRFINPKMDYKKIKAPLLPIDYTNEFIFLLTKLNQPNV